MPKRLVPEELLPLPPAIFHILLSLADGERHGYALKREIARRTDDRLRLGAGTGGRRQGRPTTAPVVNEKTAALLRDLMARK